MVNLKDNFRDWLIKQGLSEKTASGRHGTVYEYVRRIDKLCNLIYKGHNLKPWQQLAEDIYPILGFHLLCRKGDVCVTQNNIAEIKDFLNTFLSNLRQYQDNLKNYFEVKLLLDDGDCVEQYTLIKDLLPSLTTQTLLLKFNDSATQVNKNRNALEKFYQFLSDTQYINATLCYYKSAAEKTKVDDFYNDLTKKIQAIETFEIAPSDIFELIVNGGNGNKPPLFDTSEKEVPSMWVCALLRIERHTLSNIKALKPTTSSKRSYLITDVNEFITNNFVQAKNTRINPIAVKKWWTVREIIGKTELKSDQIKSLRKTKQVSYIKVTDKIYIFYPYDFMVYSSKKFTVDDKL